MLIGVMGGLEKTILMVAILAASGVWSQNTIPTVRTCYENSISFDTIGHCRMDFPLAPTERKSCPCIIYWYPTDPAVTITTVRVTQLSITPVAGVTCNTKLQVFYPDAVFRLLCASHAVGFYEDIPVRGKKHTLLFLQEGGQMTMSFQLQDPGRVTINCSGIPLPRTTPSNQTPTPMTAVNPRQSTPVSITAVPTTAAPTQLTPAVTTAAPPATTVPPAATTYPPVATTDPPAATTDPPAATTDPPAATTDPPDPITTPPAQTTAPPNPTTSIPPTPAATTAPRAPSTAPPALTTPPPTQAASTASSQASQKTTTTTKTHETTTHISCPIHGTTAPTSDKLEFLDFLEALKLLKMKMCLCKLLKKEYFEDSMKEKEKSQSYHMEQNSQERKEKSRNNVIFSRLWYARKRNDHDGEQLQWDDNM